MYKYALSYFDCYAHETRIKLIKTLDEAANLNPEYYENIKVWELGNMIDQCEIQKWK